MAGGGADGFAFAAAFALVPVKQHLGLRALTFRIVAPGAAQIAAFEKYRGSNSRPVTVGEMLDTEYIDIHEIIYFSYD